MCDVIWLYIGDLICISLQVRRCNSRGPNCRGRGEESENPKQLQRVENVPIFGSSPDPRAWCASFNFCVCFAAFLISSELKFVFNKTCTRLCPEFGINTFIRLWHRCTYMGLVWLSQVFSVVFLFSRESAHSKTSWQLENKSKFCNFMLFGNKSTHYSTKSNLVLDTFHGTLASNQDK